MINRCACFTTDLGYLFPTMLSALQARQFLERNVADVILILFTSDPAVDESFAEICLQNQIIFLVFGTDILQGHTTMYARLFLSEILPETYQRVLYIDGDVQISESLNELIRAELPAGHAFAAVPDPISILLYEAKGDFPEIKSYFDGLGVENAPSRPYFNSGVLLINFQEWAAIERDAINCLTKTPALCLRQDQSALNFAGHRKFTPMSFRWNFPIFFRNCAVERPIHPHIYHFMSNPKPWHGSFPPWNRGFFAPYERLKSEYPQISAYSKAMPLQVQVRYCFQQYFKWIQETFTWRLSGRRAAILEFDAATKF
jgi:lipopolysaccharide biosynthesis glycosyltransferase